MKKKLILLSLLSLFLAFFCSNPMNVKAGETSNAELPEPTNSEEIIIGEYDGLLTDLTDDDPNTPMPNAESAARINSYATYSPRNGIQVYVRLYNPAWVFPKIQFTSMIGMVTVDLNNSLTTETLAEYANGSTTISGTVDTGVTGNSGNSGIISISGMATAINAIAGGGAFGITYDFTIP